MEAGSNTADLEEGGSNKYLASHDSHDCQARKDATAAFNRIAVMVQALCLCRGGDTSPLCLLSYLLPLPRDCLIC